MAELLRDLTRLSHEFGGPVYLKGGGGNTSAKNADILWIKPSGTTLLEMQPELFVPLDRAKLGRLYEEQAPANPQEREAWVKDMMMAAVCSDSSGRPSVESPLHNLFDATYVVHTHPPMVNGMTCSVNGQEACRALFPDALWVDYTDPGYTLCMTVLGRMRDHTAERGQQPKAVFLANHGVFVGGNSFAEIQETYAVIMMILRAEYERAGISMALEIDPEPPLEMAETLLARLREVREMDSLTAIQASGYFTLADGPLSPDQIVYMRSFPFVGEPAPAGLKGFLAEHGYAPRIISFGSAVYGLGSSEANAVLALALARDAALVRQLSAAFGGPKYMTDAQGNFIDKWEVEAYRRKLVK